MIGFKNPAHHGWKLAGMKLERQCPYPAGTTAYEEFWQGVRHRSLGKNWNGENNGASRRTERRARVAA